MRKFKCKKCGKEINEVIINNFDYDGTDFFTKVPFKQVLHNAIYFDTDINWTGYELTDEERKEGIKCPYCKKYPFDDKEEIQTYEYVRVVCFKK